MTSFEATGFTTPDGVSVLTLPSHFNKNISFFDDANSDSDLTFTFAGIEKPLHLHRVFLRSASMTFDSVFRGQSNPYAKYKPSTQCVLWIYDKGIKDATYSSVLVKMLRYCYGEDASFRADECPVALTICSQLGLKNTEGGDGGDSRTQMETCMVETARKNGEAGAEMLNACLRELRVKDGIPLKSDCSYSCSDNATECIEMKKSKFNDNY